MDRAAREKLLLSADRFLRAGVPEGLGAEARASLLERYGLFGIRLGVVLIRDGFTDPTPLAHELARRSGLDPLLAMVGRQFQARADALKARTALVGVETLLRTSPRERAPDTWRRHWNGSRSMPTSSANCGCWPPCAPPGRPSTPNWQPKPRGLIGGAGAASHLRLGLEPDATPEADDRRGPAVPAPVAAGGGKPVDGPFGRTCAAW